MIRRQAAPDRGSRPCSVTTISTASDGRADRARCATPGGPDRVRRAGAGTAAADRARAERELRGQPGDRATGARGAHRRRHGLCDPGPRHLRRLGTSGRATERAAELPRPGGRRQRGRRCAGDRDRPCGRDDQRGRGLRDRPRRRAGDARTPAYVGRSARRTRRRRSSRWRSIRRSRSSTGQVASLYSALAAAGHTPGRGRLLGRGAARRRAVRSAAGDAASARRCWSPSRGPTTPPDD